MTAVCLQNVSCLQLFVYKSLNLHYAAPLYSKLKGQFTYQLLLPITYSKSHMAVWNSVKSFICYNFEKYVSHFKKYLPLIVFIYLTWPSWSPWYHKFLAWQAVQSQPLFHQKNWQEIKKLDDFLPVLPTKILLPPLCRVVPPEQLPFWVTFRLLFAFLNK